MVRPRTAATAAAPAATAPLRRRLGLLVLDTACSSSGEDTATLVAVISVSGAAIWRPQSPQNRTSSFSSDPHSTQNLAMIPRSFVSGAGIQLGIQLPTQRVFPRTHGIKHENLWGHLSLGEAPPVRHPRRINSEVHRSKRWQTHNPMMCSRASETKMRCSSSNSRMSLRPAQSATPFGR